MKEQIKTGEPKLQAAIKMAFEHFSLPPIEGALVIGKRAPVGLNALSNAFETMAPGMFKPIKVNNPIIEGILVRASVLRKIPQSKLEPLILRYAEKIMDETDSLHVSINIHIFIEEEVTLK